MYQTIIEEYLASVSRDELTETIRRVRSDYYIEYIAPTIAIDEGLMLNCRMLYSMAKRRAQRAANLLKLPIYVFRDDSSTDSYRFFSTFNPYDPLNRKHLSEMQCTLKDTFYPQDMQ